MGRLADFAYDSVLDGTPEVRVDPGADRTCASSRRGSRSRLRPCFPLPELRKVRMIDPLVVSKTVAQSRKHAGRLEENRAVPI
jgi:hypothetical protein